MIFKLRINQRGHEIYKVYINDDPGLTLTYFTAMSNLVNIAYCAGTSGLSSSDFFQN